MPELNANKCAECGALVYSHNKFCSRECKSKSQIVRITLRCAGCNNNFKISPCYRRKSNYCSVSCYRNYTRTKEKRICKVCKKIFIATGTQIRHGFGLFCSRKCQHKTYPKQIKKTCPQCGRVYSVPPSWAVHRNFCGKKCQDDSMRDYVLCVCRCCKKEFEIPRSDLNRGRGTYCSRKCFVSYDGSSLLEIKMEKALILSKLKFEREVKFKRFHVDFLLEKYKTAIECDGEYWHLLPSVIDRDRRKDILLQGLGYKVLRFTGNELDKLDEIKLSKLLVQKIKGRNLRPQETLLIES